MKITRRVLLAGALTVAIASPSFAKKEEVRPETTWNEIKEDIFEVVNFQDGSHLMTMEAPYRAEDAAIVPISIDVKPDSDIVKITMVIDENPAPMAARFLFGDGAANPSFSTRFRVNSYSYVRAIAETKDGTQYMVKKFVKASGGCSAPALKDPEEAQASLGKIKMRLFPKQQEASNFSPSARQAQVMIRHPNYSGLQMDQLTLLNIPLHIVDDITVRKGNKMVVKVESGISLSEDPNIRFYFKDDGNNEPLSVVAKDTEEQVFKKELTLQTGS